MNTFSEDQQCCWMTKNNWYWGRLVGYDNVCNRWLARIEGATDRAFVGYLTRVSTNRLHVIDDLPEFVAARILLDDSSPLELEHHVSKDITVLDHEVDLDTTNVTLHASVRVTMPMLHIDATFAIV